MVEDSKAAYSKKRKRHNLDSILHGAGLNLRWYKDKKIEKNNLENRDTLKIYIRSIDSCNLMTNLHSTMFPKLFRFKHHRKEQGSDHLRIVLSETDDVLCSIGPAYKEQLIQWKKSWKKFVTNIYDYTYLGINSEVGQQWSMNPNVVLDKFETYFEVPLQMSLFKDIVKSKLRYNINLVEYYKTDQYKEALKKTILAHSKEYANIKVYAHHHGCQCVYNALEDLSKDELFKKKRISVVFLEPFFYKKNVDISNIKTLIYDCYKTLNINEKYLFKTNYPSSAIIKTPLVQYKRLSQDRVKYYSFMHSNK